MWLALRAMLPGAPRTFLSMLAVGTLTLLLSACAGAPTARSSGAAPHPSPQRQQAARASAPALPPEVSSEVVMNAMGFLDVRYTLGGNSADEGLDCSGYVRLVYGQTLGVWLPRRAEAQARATLDIPRGDLQPGDLVFFNTLDRPYSHVGIYLGDDRFIHSPRSGARVRVESMNNRYWDPRFNGARRVDPAGSEALDLLGGG